MATLRQKIVKRGVVRFTQFKISPMTNTIQKWLEIVAPNLRSKARLSAAGDIRRHVNLFKKAEEALKQSNIDYRTRAELEGTCNVLKESDSAAWVYFSKAYFNVTKSLKFSKNTGTNTRLPSFEDLLRLRQGKWLDILVISAWLGKTLSDLPAIAVYCDEDVLGSMKRVDMVLDS